MSRPRKRKGWERRKEERGGVNKDWGGGGEGKKECMGAIVSALSLCFHWALLSSSPSVLLASAHFLI